MSQVEEYILNKKFVKNYIRLEYNRDLVARFIRAVPSQRAITYSTGICQSTLNQLEHPNCYDSSRLEPFSRRLWNFLSNMSSGELERTLYFTREQFQIFSRKLGTVDYSNSRIVCDEKWLKDRVPYEFDVDLDNSVNLSTIIEYLKSARGSISRLDISRNFLFDAGLKVLLEELTHHTFLRELNIEENEITEVGLEYLSKFVEDRKYKIKIKCKGNYAEAYSN